MERHLLADEDRVVESREPVALATRLSTLSPPLWHQAARTLKELADLRQSAKRAPAGRQEKLERKIAKRRADLERLDDIARHPWTGGDAA